MVAIIVTLAGCDTPIKRKKLLWCDPPRVLQEDFAQSRLDPYMPLTPNNRRSINFVRTGPGLDLRLGGTGFIDVSVRYADAYYQTSPFDSNRLLGSLAWGLRLSAVSAVSSMSTERVLFTDTLVNADFDLGNAYVRYTAQGARTELTATLAPPGSARGPRTSNGPLAQPRVTYALSPSAKLTFSAARPLTDPSASFSSIKGGAITTIDFEPVIPEIVHDQSA
jgi:hypothetical protein